jgi:hypothetical protein
MKGHETQSGNATGGNVKLLAARQHGTAQYQKVFDARKRRLRGFWGRNGAFYGQLTVTGPRAAATGAALVPSWPRDGKKSAGERMAGDVKDPLHCLSSVILFAGKKILFAVARVNY